MCIEISSTCRAPLKHPRDCQPPKNSVAADIVIRYKRVDIVVDTYQDISIKSTELSKRGSARKIIMRSEKSKSLETSTSF